MSKLNQIVPIGILSGLLGTLSEYFGFIEGSYLVLLMLIVIDTCTGVAKAVKSKKFSSEGFKRLVAKILLYSTTILAVRLLEISIRQLILTTLLAQITIASLAISETISILENMAFLGVPLSASAIWRILVKLKIGTIVNVYEDIDKNIQNYMKEIDDIIKFSLPTINDSNMRKLLVIKFEVWKSIAVQICNLQGDKNGNGKELIYYRVMALIQSGFKEMHNRWEIERISAELINNFNSEHEPKVELWLQKVHEICFSVEELSIKKQKLVESILVVLYQTILDARKGLYHFQ